MNEAKLKPCPFCGGNASYIATNCYAQNYVRCPDCGASIWGKDDERPSRKEIVKIWNRRETDEMQL